MPGKLTGYPLANSKGTHWPNVGRNLDAAAVHILTHRDIPGPWSKKRKVPPGTLHAKDIEEELDLDDVEGCQVYLRMKEDSRFYKPPVRKACFGLTEFGDEWATQRLR
jgi:hypothetical protein